MFKYPKLQKHLHSVEPSTVARGERFAVSAIVEGGEENQVVPVPTSVVLAIDWSGSVGGSEAEIRDAVQAVANHLTARAAGDRLGLLVFTSGIELQHAPSTQYGAAITSFNNLGSPSGGTDLQLAFQQSINMLSNAPTSNRLVVLLSDGWATAQHENYITTHVGDAVDEGVRFFTIGFGPEPRLALLDAVLAGKTNGSYRAASASNLLGDLIAAFDEGAKTLSTTNVKIRYELAAGFTAVPGTFGHSFPSALEESTKFKTQLDQEVAAFVASNSLDLPEIKLLPKGLQFSFSFEAAATDCDPLQDVQKQVNTAKAVVKYVVGPDPKTGGEKARIDYFNNCKVTVLACGLHPKKNFIDEDHRTEISLTNTSSIEGHDLRVEEVVERHFELTGHAQPQPLRLDKNHGQIVWDLGSLAPGSDTTVSFGLQLRPQVTTSPPYDVNFSRARYQYRMRKEILLFFQGSPEYNQLAGDAQTLSLSQQIAALISGVVMPQGWGWWKSSSVEAGAPLVPYGAGRFHLGPIPKWLSDEVTGPKYLYEIELTPSEVRVYRLYHGDRLPQTQTRPDYPTG